MSEVYEKALRVQADARAILKQGERGFSDEEALMALSKSTLSLLAMPIADGLDVVANAHTMRQVAEGIVCAAEEPKAVIDLAIGLLRGLESQITFQQALVGVTPEGMGLFPNYAPDNLN